MVNGLFGGGDGTEANPFLIEDAEDLNAVRNNLNAHYKQVASINMKNINWTPIGIYEDDYFVGSYDGNNYRIENLTINKIGSIDAFLALFYGSKKSLDGDSPVFKNINLINFVINGADIFYCAGLVGEAYDTQFINCHAKGVINEGYSCGGLVGDSYNSTYYRCSADIKIGNMNAIHDYGGNGGLAGSAYGWDETVNFRECLSKGTIISNYDNGGLIGGAHGVKIINCYSNVNLIVQNELSTIESFGGLTGHTSNATIQNCYATGYVPNGESCNGITGYRYDTVSVSDTYFDQDTTGKNSDGYGIPKTTEEMKKQITFENWDFENIWRIDENNDYPRFKWEPVKCKAFPLGALKVNVIN